MTDQYERSAEFVDIMLAAHWSALGPALVEALHGSVGPINASEQEAGTAPG
uniref:hypothetical protein n=1 Tax=Microbispora cellulosiformans TaxID=2614688 RepID=UPI0017857176|nr:hypothetical protein [Microbispora cellulosiformans]